MEGRKLNDSEGAGPQTRTPSVENNEGILSVARRDLRRVRWRSPINNEGGSGGRIDESASVAEEVMEGSRAVMGARREMGARSRIGRAVSGSK